MTDNSPPGQLFLQVENKGRVCFGGGPIEASSAKPPRTRKLTENEIIYIYNHIFSTDEL